MPNGSNRDTDFRKLINKKIMFMHTQFPGACQSAFCSQRRKGSQLPSSIFKKVWHPYSCVRIIPGYVIDNPKLIPSGGICPDHSHIRLRIALRSWIFSCSICSWVWKSPLATHALPSSTNASSLKSSAYSCSTASRRASSLERERNEAEASSNANVSWSRFIAVMGIVILNFQHYSPQDSLPSNGCCQGLLMIW